MIVRIFTAAVVATVALASTHALARGDAAAGQAKAKQVCAACHGENGDKPLQPDYPILAGQHQDYLAKALRDYKTGARKNAVMNGQAQALSGKDINDLSAWFASRQGPLFVKR
jgi:cytochrome c553